MLTRKRKTTLKVILIIGIVSTSILLYFFFIKPKSLSDHDESSDYDQNPDLFLVKYNSDGDLIWKFTMGMSSVDEGHDIAFDKDNNILVVGEINAGIGTYQDVVLIKLNSKGSQLWKVTWGGPDHESGKGIVIDNKSNIYITGTTDGYGSGENDAFIVKFDNNGSQLWNSTWGGIYDEYANDIIIDNETNIYITGRTESIGAGEYDAFIAKFNGTNGNQIWNTTWGGPDFDVGTGLVFDNKTSIYLVGGTLSFGAGKSDVFISKYYLNGTKIWNYTWGYSTSEKGHDITIDSSNNIYITGFLFNFGSVYEDVILVKHNSDGNQLWNITWGGSGNEEGQSIAIDKNDNIYITGHQGYHYYVLKYDSDANQKWARNPGAFEYFSGNGIAIDNSNDIYVTGLTYW